MAQVIQFDVALIIIIIMIIMMINKYILFICLLLSFKLVYEKFLWFDNYWLKISDM